MKKSDPSKGTRIAQSHIFFTNNLSDFDKFRLSLCQITSYENRKRKKERRGIRMNKFAATLATVACCTACGYAQAPLFYPASPVAVGQGSGEVFLVDLNRDGHLDLITKHLVQRKLTVFSGDGKGHFVPAAEGSMDFDVMPGAVAL